MDFEEWKLWREEQSERDFFYNEMRSISKLGLFFFGLTMVIIASAAIYFVAL
jgi:hypothetical protein